MSFDKDQIQALIIADVKGGITPQERKELQEIVMSDPAAAECAQAVRAFLLSRETLQGEANLHSNIDLASLMRSNSSSTSRRFMFSIAAAAVLLLAVASVYLFRGHKDVITVKNVATALPNSVTFTVGNNNPISLTGNDSTGKAGNIAFATNNHTLTYTTGTTKPGETGVIQVPAGCFYTLRLPDGTSVVLNSETTLRFPLQFDEESRNIWVDGEAYIDVKTDANRPFTVHLRNTTVEVLGTTFNVNTYDGGESISLVNGAIRVVAEKDSVTLKPGRQAKFNADKLTVSSFDPELTSWKDGEYHFTNATMVEVGKVIERWYGVKATIHATAANKRFFGTLERKEPIEQFLKSYQMTGEITYTLDKDGIHIK